MGIISGFLRGAGQGAAQAGQMLLQDKLMKERDEANYLRDATLKSGLQTQDQEFRGEMELSRQKNLRTLQDERIGSDVKSAEELAGTNKDAAKLLAESRERIAEWNAKGTNTLTSQQKNIRYLMSEEGGGLSRQEAVVLTFPEATIEHTDPNGNITVVERQLGGGLKSIATIQQNDQDLPEVVPEGDEVSRTKATKEERQAESNLFNSESGNDDDWIPGNEKGPNHKDIKESSSAKLRAGVKPGEPWPADHPDNPNKTETPGLIGSEAAASKESKVIKTEQGEQSYTFEQFATAMRRQHGRGATKKAIQETWDSIK
jgi:hypothetical protein